MIEERDSVSWRHVPALAQKKAVLFDGQSAGRVWCRLGTYDILKAGNVYEVLGPMKAVRNTEKELVVARKVGDGYEIHAFKFPVGMMGIRSDTAIIPDFDKFEQAYRAYCEKGKREIR